MEKHKLFWKAFVIVAEIVFVLFCFSFSGGRPSNENEGIRTNKHVNNGSVHLPSSIAHAEELKK